MPFFGFIFHSLDHVFLKLPPIILLRISRLKKLVEEHDQQSPFSSPSSACYRYQISLCSRLSVLLTVFLSILKINERIFKHISASKNGSSKIWIQGIKPISMSLNKPGKDRLWVVDLFCNKRGLKSLPYYMLGANKASSGFMLTLKRLNSLSCKILNTLSICAHNWLNSSGLQHTFLSHSYKLVRFSLDFLPGTIWRIL